MSWAGGWPGGLVWGDRELGGWVAGWVGVHDLPFLPNMDRTTSQNWQNSTPGERQHSW